MILSRVFLLSALIGLACLSVALADDIQVDDPDVTVLTEDNFDAFIQNELTLVEFYAPWCGHCKALAPEYGIAATLLKGDGVKLGKLDATIQTKVAGRFAIQGYPTLKVFRNGKPFDYNGPRKADGIAAYMRKQVGPSAKPISTDGELQALIASDPIVGYVVTAFFNDDKVSQLQSSFGMIANRMRDEFIFARTTDVALKAKYGVPANGEALIAFLHGDKTVYDGSSKTADVESFIRLNSVPLVGEFSDKTAPIYQGRKLPIAKLFLKVDRSPKSKTMTYYTNRLKKIAKQFEGKILVTYADKVEQKGQLEHLNMQEEEHGFVIEDMTNQKLYKYEPEEDDEDDGKKSKNKKKGLDVEGWIKHIDEFLSGDASPYVKSQRTPKNNLKNPVKIATANNFEDLIEQDEKDVMIEFYAPWCGHCKALEPKYEQLGKKFLSNDNIVIAKLDATANDFDRTKYSVSGYPTIFFKPAGKKAVVYDGAREVSEMASYIKKNGKAGKKSKKNKKNKKKSKKNKKKREEEEEEDDE